MFHTSQLKLAIGPTPVNPTLPAQITADVVLDAEQESILDLRSTFPDSENPNQALIKWKHLPEYEATWEDIAATAHKFPSFHLEDRVALWGQGKEPTWKIPNNLFQKG